MSYFHQQNLDYLSKTLGTQEEWDKAFLKFCDKSKNIYDIPTNRKKLKKEFAIFSSEVNLRDE